MDIQLRANQLELTDEIRAYANEKLGELKKFLPEGTLAKMDVELERTTNHHQKGNVFRVWANLMVPGEMLRADESEETLFQAINKVKSELQRQLVQYKDTQADKQKKDGRELKEETHSSELI